MLTITTIRQRLATGAAVSALALGMAVGLGAREVPSAHAMQWPRLCVYYNQDTGEVEFHLPGESLVIETGAGGAFLECGWDGRWHQLAITQTTMTLTPRPLPAVQAVPLKTIR